MSLLNKLIVGAAGGAILAIWLNIIVFAYIWSYTIWIACPILMILGAIFATIKPRLTYICSAAAMGCYMTIRGISAFIGHYPHDMLFQKEYENTSNAVFLCVFISKIGTPSWNLFLFSSGNRDCYFSNYSSFEQN